MEAVIIAGGKGTRLGDTTRETPKPMIHIGNWPVLRHQISLLHKYGIQDIYLLVNYLKDKIVEYFGDGSRFGVRITYIEENVPLGTAGSLKAIENRLSHDFLVLYGDILVNMDLRLLIDFHRQKVSQCTLVLHPNDHPDDSDLVNIDAEGRIMAFYPKPHDPNRWYRNLVNAGVYILSPEVLLYIQAGKSDFGRDVFPELLHTVRMFGYVTPEYLKDMGTPDRLIRVREDFESGKVERKNLTHSQKAIFLDRDGVLNVEKSFISSPDGLEIYDFTPSAIRKINQSEYLSVVVTNQSAVARNLCTEEDVHQIHNKMETMLGREHAWLDAIYYCPHHPDKGFPEENIKYKIDCECRKPKTGMFRQAAEAMHIDLQDSFMIGDSERDIQAGINAGCVTVGVRTGYGIRKSKVQPDYLFADLREAVDFIVDEPYRKTLDKLEKAYQSFTGRHPWIVLIGGNTRSGKSTLASCLRIAFQRKGIRVLQIQLDNWLIPEQNRSGTMDVYQRFQLHKVENDLLDLFAGRRIERIVYKNHPDAIQQAVTYDPTGIQVIMIEGVVALSSERIRNKAHMRIFTQVDPDRFMARIADYYTWRGKSAEEIASLVHKRKTDEYQVIEKESKLADLIVNPFSA